MIFKTTQLNFSITTYQEAITVNVTKPNPEFLDDIGEQGMRDLLDRFYLLLVDSPIKDIFPKDKEVIREAGQNSADFFIQICGGTPYFNQNKGTPKMRKRHAPFAITPNGRVHWLILFEEALKPIVQNKQSSSENIQSFWNYLDIFSQWMINEKD